MRGAGRAHYEKGNDVVVIFAGEEYGRIPAAEVMLILQENIPIDGRATKILERIQAMMGGDIPGSDIAQGLDRISTWISKISG